MKLRFALLAALLSAPLAARAETFKFEEVNIKSKVQKPEIQILITKQNLTPKYELELKESFAPKILQSIEQKPF